MYSKDIDDLIIKTKTYTEKNQRDALMNVSIIAEKILDEIIAELKPGIRESEAVELARQIFHKNDIQKLWHRPIIRFNKNTLCSFKDRPTEDYVLQDEDIAFVDIGIVKNGIEGDIGKTIVFGKNKKYEHLKHSSELLFQMALTFWRNNNSTGIELYDYIAAEATKLNVAFNLDPAGHLIGSFPHTHAWTKGANHFPLPLVAGGWILEIQIRSLTEPYGAFYEGLLY